MHTPVPVFSRILPNFPTSPAQVEACNPLSGPPLWYSPGETLIPERDERAAMSEEDEELDEDEEGEDEGWGEDEETEE